MSIRNEQYRLLPLIFFFLSGVVFLLGLGIWQLQRLEWKQALIERIEARVGQPPMALDQVLQIWDRDRDVEYLRVRVEGEFDHKNERHYFTVVNGQSGWKVISPLRIDESRIVLVDRGFVPDSLKDPSKRSDGQIEGPVSLVGLVRSAPEQKGFFVPDNNVEKNQWFWRDLKGMVASFHGNTDQGYVPFFVEAEKMQMTGEWPRGGVTRLNLPNNHLQYALTWFGLAVTLIIVFGLFIRKRDPRS